MLGGGNPRDVEKLREATRYAMRKRATTDARQFFPVNNNTFVLRALVTDATPDVDGL